MSFEVPRSASTFLGNQCSDNKVVAEDRSAAS